MPVEVALDAIAGVFNLPKEGADSFSDLELSVDVEFAHFAADKNVEFEAKHSNIRTDLDTPFNYICELYTKSVACSIGTLGQLSDTKLFAVTVIVDSLTGTKFNWHGWFINQMHEVAKDFKYEKGSTEEILRKGKLKFFSRISFALEKLFTNRRWTNTVEYKKNTIFFDLYKTDKIVVDLGVFDVDVLPAAPVAERRSETKKPKRTASPAKRVAPKRAKKVKRVASLFEASEAEKQPLEEEVEVDKPQPSPAKEQTQTPPVQIQIQQPQEPQTSSTTQPHTQPQPEASNTQKQTSPHSLYEAESTSSIPIPKIPFLSTDLDAAYTLFEPTQTQ